MNLIQDAWIPVKNAQGEQMKIAPWQITEEEYTLSAPRADFNGALYQFLIGLLQTTLGMELDDQDDWKEKYEEPPSVDELKEKMKTVAHAFNLDGDGPRFMQELGGLGEAKEEPVQRLLLDAPGGNGVKQNTDFFVRRNLSGSLCSHCAALALFNMQTNAPGGGAGYRTSLRGTGPLTSVVAVAGLWKTLWLNVLPQNDFFGNFDHRLDEKNVFPWVGATRESTKGSSTEKTVPEDVSLLQYYWAMPRRIELCFDSLDESKSCLICGELKKDGVSSFKAVNYGVNYEGGWVHPLSPHNRNKEGLLFSQKCSAGIFRYRNWLGLATESENRICAQVVNCIPDRDIDENEDVSLLGMGYDIYNNMKVRAWREGKIPLYTFPSDSIKDDFLLYTQRVIDASEKVVLNLRDGVKQAYLGSLDSEKGKKPSWGYGSEGASFSDSSIWLSIESQFWSETEALFYSRQRDILDSLKKDEDVYPILEAWHKEICRMTLEIFDRWTEKGGLVRSRIREVSYARSQLKQWIYGANITKKILGLPEKEEV